MATYDDSGRGERLVLLHGFPLDRRMWAQQGADLAEGCRLIAPDLWGFGQNTSAEPFTMESQADGVHGLLEQLGALPCVLGGLSMGGYIALAYARKYAGSLRGLVLINTKAEGDTAGAKEGRARMIELARTSGAAAIAAEMMPRLVRAGTAAVRPQIIAALRQMMEQAPVQTIVHALEAMRDRADQTDLLGNIAVPTLIIVGDADAITPPAVAEGMHKAVRGSQLVIVRGAGHMSPMEQPSQVSGALRRFVGRL